jgi:hypothetical protein
MIAYIKKTERSQINDLMLHLKLLEKQEQANPNKQKERNCKKKHYGNPGNHQRLL